MQKITLALAVALMAILALPVATTAATQSQAGRCSRRLDRQNVFLSCKLPPITSVAVHAFSTRAGNRFDWGVTCGRAHPFGGSFLVGQYYNLRIDARHHVRLYRLMHRTSCRLEARLTRLAGGNIRLRLNWAG